jgi:putative DNA primase/helicase
MNTQTTTTVQTNEPQTTEQQPTEVTAVSSFKDIAMEMVKRGIPVIPIPPRQKGTVLKNWPNLASTDPAQIEKWHQGNQHYNAGAVAKLDGYWILDCDVPDLHERIEKETGHTFPDTFSVKSGKGMHFYFRHTAASRALKKNISAKDEQGNTLFDAKINNGYVVAPGSVHPTGKQYEIVNDSDIVEASDCLVAWIEAYNLHSEADEQQLGAEGGKVNEGGRDKFLFKEACKLSAAGLSKSNALTALNAINKEKCNPPMEEAVVRAKIESAFSYDKTTHAMTVESLIQNGDLASSTDLGNARRLVKAEGMNIRYCYKNKSWYLWDGEIWAKDETGGIQRLAKKTVKGILNEALDLDEEQSKILVAHEHGSESEARLNSMVSLARSEEGVPIRLVDLDCNPMLFNCKNGTIDLNTGQVREHRRDDLISKLSSVEYDPVAQCSTWLKFLDTITEGNEELSNYLQRCVGYSMTGVTCEDALFLLYGTGSNGKRFVFGDYSEVADFGSLVVSNNHSIRNDLAKLNGARFVTASESNSGKRLDEEVIKKLTGGDMITARYLYSDHFNFTPQFKLWLGTNHKPIIRGQDNGIWRRIRLIPFTVSIPTDEVDLHLTDKLKLEAPGILKWALKGLADWQEDGLREPSVVYNATQEYRSEQDVLAHFLNTRCILEKDAKSKARDLYMLYKGWAEATGEHVMNERAFSNALKERGFEQGNRKSAGNVLNTEITNRSNNLFISNR